MAHADQNTLMTTIVLLIVFSSGIIITLGIVGMQLLARLKAIEVLKTYAEKGEEPPPGLAEAVHQIGKPPAPAAPPVPRYVPRAEHLAHFAANIVLAIGAAGVAWWRGAAQHGGPPEGLMVFAIIVAIFFAGSAAARLVGVLTTRDGP
jgi:hypothetical protein